MTVISPYHPAPDVPLDSVGGAAGLTTPATSGEPWGRAGGPGGPGQARPRRRRDVLILTTATLLGLWFGLAAPSVSPVTPPGPDPSVVSVAAGPAVAAPAVPAAPVEPVDPAGQDPGRGARAGQDAGGRGGPDGGGRR